MAKPKQRSIKLLLCLIFPLLLLLLLLLLLFFFLLKLYRSKHRVKVKESSIETAVYNTVYDSPDETETETGDLLTFPGGEDLTAIDILEAPGEIIGRSSYATVYRACVRRTGSTVLLRFVRPACIQDIDIVPVVKTLASVTHGNLVPLKALYVGPRGEKLFVHPFYAAGTLAQFLRVGVDESHCQRWEITCKLSLGITKGLKHLHHHRHTGIGMGMGIIHGNIKTSNVLLDANLQPRLSDFGLHLLLSPTAAQEMLEASALQGYKAPELIKMKDATKESDIYSLGVLLLETLTQRDPIKILSFLHSKDLLFEREIAQLFKGRSNGNGNGDGLLDFFRLAMDCCHPLPALRPDVNTVYTKLHAICSS